MADGVQSRPTLVKPRDLVSQELATMHRSGVNLLGTPMVNDPARLAEFRERSSRWRNKVFHFLQSSFSDVTVSHAFTAGYAGSLDYSSWSTLSKFSSDMKACKERVDNLEKIIDVLDYYEESSPVTSMPSKPSNQAVFIVHGHDEAAKANTARLVEQLGLKPIILHEQAGKSRTIVEKFEEHASEAGFAIVIASPDDVGAVNTPEPKLAPRARQNVWLELGYFVGKLGRSRVALLRVGDVEIPSDLLGVEYKPLDEGGKWRYDIVGELQAAGFAVSKDQVKG